MRFAQSQLLWLVVTVVPLLAVFLWWSWQRRKRLMREFIPQRLLTGLTIGFSPSVERRRLVLVVLATAALLVALARPQWGLVWEEATTQGRDILVAVDASRSMLAVDSPPTDRLTRAKLAALDLAQIAESDRFGLIAFAGSAFLQCPLTLDDFAFAQSVNAIDTEIIPQGGTALAGAIDTAVKAFEKSGDNHRVLVLLTDGEDHEEGVDAAVRRAQKAGLRIFTVGVGTPAGELIRVPDEQGNMGFLRDEQGNAVRSRLNETLLKEIATETGGFYLALSGARPMETLFKRGIELLPKTESATTLTRSYREQFHWFVLLAVAGLIVEMFWRGKMETKTDALAQARTAGTAVKTTLGLLLVAGATGLMAGPSKALQSYRAGEYGKAQAEYERVLEERARKARDFGEKDAKLEFNAGASAYKAGDFEKARQHFSMSAGAEDLGLQQRSLFNLGNALYRQGEESQDLEEREVIWEDAVRNLASAVELDGTDADAKHNHEIVRQKLQRLKQQLDEMAAQQPQQGEGQQNQRNSRRNRRDRQQQQGQQPGQQQQQGQGQDGQEQSGKGRQNQGQGSGGDEQDDRADSGNGRDKDEDGRDGDRRNADEDGREGGRDGEENGRQAGALKGVMTPHQARQLLEAMKAEERTIIFAPTQPQGGQVQPRRFKDW
jgi:Ca-activated chloride channel family protein